MPARPRLHHVSVPRPPGSHAQARRFYGAVLGFEEVAPPESLRHLDLVWFRLGATELHLFVGPPAAVGSGQHLCIEVEDLPGLRARLHAANHATRDADAIPGRPRFFCDDPFGNVIEFTTLDH